MIDLKPEYLALVREILGKWLPGREVRAFGSRVTFTAKPHSDLDLVVMGTEPVPDRALAEIAETFAASDLPIRVDLLAGYDLPESLRARILEKNAVIQEGA